MSRTNPIRHIATLALGAAFGLSSIMPSTGDAAASHAQKVSPIIASPSRVEAAKQVCDRMLKGCRMLCQKIKDPCRKPACYAECSEVCAECLRDAERNNRDDDDD
jgi:hypothetical protein